jgi:putative SOS response-associated peptidase YedK
MCGRFTVTADGETVVREFGLNSVPFDYRPRYNVAPMQDVLAVIHDGAQRRAGWMRWGLLPNWADDPAAGARMINARSETIDERSAFREAYERRRCVIVADGFYEWQQLGSTKIPTRIRLTGNRLFGFAGLWEKWSRRGGEPVITCTILTTSPAPSIAHVHDRMPVILDPDACTRWLDKSADPDSLKSLLIPFDDQQLEAYPVSNLVNYVENDGPECVEQVQPPAVTEQTTLF